MFLQTNIQLSLKSTNGSINVFLCPEENDQDSPVKSETSSSDYLSTSDEEIAPENEGIHPDMLPVHGTQDANFQETLGCNLERIPETDEDLLIPFSPFREDSDDYFHCLTEEEGLMDLYDMYDLQPSYPLDI